MKGLQTADSDGLLGGNMQIVLLSRHNYDECGDAIQGGEGGSFESDNFGLSVRWSDF